MDLTTPYMGQTLKNPLVPSAAPPGQPGGSSPPGSRVRSRHDGAGHALEGLRV